LLRSDGKDGSPLRLFAGVVLLSAVVERLRNRIISRKSAAISSIINASDLHR